MSVAHNDNYVQYFTQGDELDFEFENHKKQTDTGMFVVKSYDNGKDFVSLETAEANLILAIDAVKSAKSQGRIDELTFAVRQRIEDCKFYLPLKKRKMFWAAVRETSKPIYFLNEKNDLLTKLDLGENPKQLKKDTYNLKIPMIMKKEIWAECDKQIALNERYNSLKALIAS